MPPFVRDGDICPSGVFVERLKLNEGMSSSLQLNNKSPLPPKCGPKTEPPKCGPKMSRIRKPISYLNRDTYIPGGLENRRMYPHHLEFVNRENIPYARVSTYADGRDSTYPESEKNAASVCKKAGANVCAALDQGLRYHLNSTIVTIVTVELIN